MNAPDAPKRYLVTAALPYANGPIHIGHLAGAYLPADIYSRYLRSMGRDVVFVCGSDEHGVAVTLRAQKEGLTPQQIIDKYHPIIRDSLLAFGISFDNYSRTSLPVHHETAQEFFSRFHDKGLFVEKETEQYFDPEAGRFLPDRYVTGTCPVCSSPNAYGDQCEKCGSSLSPTDLIDPKSAYTGQTPELRKTSHWFLPLDRMQHEWLDGYVASQQDRWKPNVYGQCKSWLDAGLQPRAITRDLDWGVPLPLAGTQGKVLYVWFDAPIGYISSTKEWAQKRGTPDAWKPYWQDKDTALVHFIGKDNIVFHTLIFPAMLHYHGDYIVPTQVPANEFLNLEGDKMSTSRNYAVWLHEYAADFPGKADVLRYVLAATMPETKDNDFTWKDFQARNNNELVAILGNFVNRVLTLVQKYYGGVVPDVDRINLPDLGEVYNQIRSLTSEVLGESRAIRESIENFRFREALFMLINIARKGNTFLQHTEPWKKVESEPETVKHILFNSLQLLGHIAVYLEPFMPNKSKELFNLLNAKPRNIDESYINAKSFIGENSNYIFNHYIRIFVPSGTQLPAPTLLFEKIEDEVVAAQVARLAKQGPPAGQALPPAPPTGRGVPPAVGAAGAGHPTVPATQESLNPTPLPMGGAGGGSLDAAGGGPALAPAKAEIAFPDFEKLDIRVATITAAERVPKADRLLKLTLDTGLDTRTVVSGIAEHYAPEAIVGQRVCLLANLAPRKLKGIDSQGMVLMAESPDGTLRFVQPTEGLPNGSVVR